MQNVCIATYRCFDDKADFHKKAQNIAVGMTVGSWTELPDVQKKHMEKHLGRVVAVDVQEAHENPTGERYADIQIAFPDLNFSADLPALLVTVFGKVSMDGRIKLVDLDFSSAFLSHFSGAKFGLHGVRQLLGVHDRPLLMSIFKSVIGYELDALRDQFYAQAVGGVDIIKDDEILFENPLSPIEKRVEICLQAAEQASQITGQRILYATNLTGHTSQLATQAKKAISAGANALLFNVFAYGLDILQELAADPDIHVPIMAHPAFAGAMYPSPHYGVSPSLLLGKLLRIAGADIVLFPSPYGSVVMPKTDNLAIQQALLDPALASHLKPGFPVPSAGIHPGLVPLIYRDFGLDVIVNAGGGIHGHPLGTIAGGQAFRQAIEATLQDIPLATYASTHRELQVALDTWGGH